MNERINEWMDGWMDAIGNARLTGCPTLTISHQDTITKIECARFDKLIAELSPFRPRRQVEFVTPSVDIVDMAMRALENAAENEDMNLPLDIGPQP